VLDLVSADDVVFVEDLHSINLVGLFLSDQKDFSKRPLADDPDDLETVEGELREGCRDGALAPGLHVRHRQAADGHGDRVGVPAAAAAAAVAARGRGGGGAVEGGRRRQLVVVVQVGRLVVVVVEHLVHLEVVHVLPQPASRASARRPSGLRGHGRELYAGRRSVGLGAQEVAHDRGLRHARDVQRLLDPALQDPAHLEQCLRGVEPGVWPPHRALLDGRHHHGEVVSQFGKRRQLRRRGGGGMDGEGWRRR